MFKDIGDEKTYPLYFFLKIGDQKNLSPSCYYIFFSTYQLSKAEILFYSNRER